MIPIHELVSRIRWDEQFAQGRFEIVYYHRIDDAMIRLPFERLVFDPEEHARVLAYDDDAIEHKVPYHRIRQVYKDSAYLGASFAAA